MAALLPFTLFLSTLCFGIGIVLPLLQVDRLYFFTDQPSLAGIVAGLWREDDYILAALIGLFSLVFPAAKLGFLHLTAYSGATRVPAWFRVLSNWSMLDVVLVAVVIFAAKTSGLATAFTKPGLWFFAASVLLIAGASYILQKQKGADRN